MQPPSSGSLPQNGTHQHHVDRNTPHKSQLLKAALDLADNGRPVFPVRPAPDKSPLTRRGHLDATTDASRVHLYWSRRRNASIGVATGKRGGFWVLDVDDLGALEKLEAVMAHDA